MYIALEGIKGSGKTSIIRQILKSDIGGHTSLFPITGPINGLYKAEFYRSAQPKLRNNDTFMEKLFLNRAIYNNSKVDTNKPIILGDRSVLTSYVTRWNKWNDPAYTIRRIGQQYKNIRKPDVILFLKNKVEFSVKNIAGRIPKQTGHADEKIEKLKMADDLYQLLLLEGEYCRKITHAQIISLNANDELTLITQEIINIIKYYAKK